MNTAWELRSLILRIDKNATPRLARLAKNSVANSLRSAVSCALVCAALIVTGANALAATPAACPCPSDSINTDRPGVTNSSTVVPYGSFEAESGSDWMASHGANSLSGSSTRLRVGVYDCTEFLIDAPNYVGSLNRGQPTGFSDVVVSLKHQFTEPFGLTGFTISATAGLGFPSGSEKISGRGYQPYIQAPWSYDLPDNWTAGGMFTVSWFPSESSRNPTFGPTFSLGKQFFDQRANINIEYGGAYDHQRPMHVLDTLGQWRFTKRQQLDFQAGFGLNNNSVDHFFGIGYSFRLDRLWGR